jgi:hypothetical protein
VVGRPAAAASRRVISKILVFDHRWPHAPAALLSGSRLDRPWPQCRPPPPPWRAENRAALVLMDLCPGTWRSTRAACVVLHGSARTCLAAAARTPGRRHQRRRSATRQGSRR